MKKIKSRNMRLKNQRGLRLVIFLILILLGIRFGTYVDAGMNDSTLVKNRVDDVYAIATVNGVQRIFYLNMYTMNGRVAYCIDLGTDIITDIYNSTDNFLSTSLSASYIDYIKLMGYFGYLYDGHDDYQYYMAAQELIWEMLDSSAEIEWTNVLDVNGERINIETYKNEIETLAGRYLVRPRFKTIKSSYVVGDEIVLVDDRDVLSGYEIQSVDYSDVSINGNNLVIKVGNKKGTEKIRLVRKKYYDYNSLLYYYDGSQRLISSGNFREVYEIVSFTIKGISLKAQVIDKLTNEIVPLGQASFEGAIYEVYDENKKLLGTYETDVNGKFKVDDLVAGTYYIKQIKASTGYLLNEEMVRFELSNDNDEVKLSQEVIGNDIEIRKVYGANSSYVAEEGIKFEIYDKVGNIYNAVITNKEGIASIWLPYGEYRISQSNTTLGYSKVDDFWIMVKEVRDVVKYNLFNEFLFTKVRVITRNMADGHLLNGEEILYKVRKKGDANYLEFEGSDIFAANDEGILLIPILFSYGDYVLEQISVPKGFLLNEEGQEFKIDSKSNFSLIDGELVMDIYVDNEIIIGKINVYANEEKFYTDVGSYGYKKVSKADEKFSLVAAEDILVNGDVKYNKGEIVFNGKTDENGNLVIDNVFLGGYCLVNESTYEEKCLVLESEDNKSKIVSRDVEFTKELEKSDIIIHNISNKGENIKDSVFELINNEGITIYSGITNDEGIIKVENILNENYCVIQRSISSKYKENKDKICFSLINDKKIEFINEVMSKKVISIPNTLSKFMGFYEIVLILVMIGTGILVYKKIFASKLSR